jgi:hypothetical protein
VSVRRDWKLLAVTLGERHGHRHSTDLSGLRSIFRSLIRCDLGFLARGAAAGIKRSAPVSRSGRDQRPRAYAATLADSQQRGKSRGSLRGLAILRRLSAASVAASTDSDADAGCMNADPAISVAATLIAVAAIAVAARSIAV